MQKRAARLTVVALLVAAALGTSYFIRDTTQRLNTLQQSAGSVDAQLDRVAAAVGELAASQQAYVAPGRADDPWLARTWTLLHEIDAEIAALRPLVRATSAGTPLRRLADALDAFVRADTRAREYLRDGQELMASDVIFSEGRDAAAAMARAVAELRRVEASRAEADRQALIARGGTSIGITALLWLAGLLALATVPRRVAVNVSTAVAEPEEAPRAVEQSRGQATPLDLAAAAAVCTDISRITSAAALPDLLEQAATVLDASGIIVWMGAGEELFAVSAHGYDPRILARLGPLRREAANATAAAWRSAELRTVSGEAAANGAVVAPMFGPDGCIGVLAVEVRPGREAEPSTRAVTSIFAAQLASVVAAWPAASGRESSGRARPERPAATA